MPLYTFLCKAFLEVNLTHRLERVPGTELELFVLSMSHVVVFGYSRAERSRALVKRTKQCRRKYLALITSLFTQSLWDFFECAAHC